MLQYNNTPLPKKRRGKYLRWWRQPLHWFTNPLQGVCQTRPSIRGGSPTEQTAYCGIGWWFGNLLSLQGEQDTHSDEDQRHGRGSRALAAIDVNDLAVFVGDMLGVLAVHRREPVEAIDKVLAQVRAALVTARVRHLLSQASQQGVRISRCEAE